MGYGPGQRDTSTRQTRHHTRLKQDDIDIRLLYRRNARECEGPPSRGGGEGRRKRARVGEKAAAGLRAKIRGGGGQRRVLELGWGVWVGRCVG